MTSIQALLAAWGRSQAINDPGAIGYPHQTTFARLARSTGSWGLRSPPLDDETHLLVDSAASLLRSRDVERHQAIVDHYVLRLSDARAAKWRRASRSTVRDRRQAAEAWLEGRLYDLLDGVT